MKFNTREKSCFSTCVEDIIEKKSRKSMKRFKKSAFSLLGEAVRAGVDCDHESYRET